MPQIMGSGAAVFDYDNDGRLDLYLLQNAGPDSKITNRLFHQEEDGTFKDVTAGSGLDISGYCMGVAIGDVNNDGLPDVLVTEYRGARLFLNNGNGTFTEVTKEAGLDNPLWGASAAFFDYDRDGWLDLVIVNYVEYDPARKCSSTHTGRRDFCHPSEFKGTVTKLFRNQGVGSLFQGGPATASGQSTSTPGHPEKDSRPLRVPHFEDVTVKSGLASLPGPGLGVVCADFTGDGWPDIFVANDSHANHLWVNQRDGTFKEEALGRGVAVNRMSQVEGNMGIAYGDVDGDGLMDLFVTHLTDEMNRLWRQGPRGFFVDQTQQLGLATSAWRGTGFGTVLADFNHKGALDLAVVNGRVGQPIGEYKSDFWSNYAERNQLFVNNGKGSFQDISPQQPAFCGTPGVYRGLVCADLNNDGAMDLLVTDISKPARIYRNIAPKMGHWIIIRALVACDGVGSLFQGGPDTPIEKQTSAPGRPEKDSRPLTWRDAYGAEITVSAGGRSWVRLLQPGQSYLCSNDPRVHFGLGQNSQVDSIEVIWPDGSREKFHGQAADRIVTLRQGEGSRQ